jgi:hypothetical protein
MDTLRLLAKRLMLPELRLNCADSCQLIAPPASNNLRDAKACCGYQKPYLAPNYIERTASLESVRFDLYAPFKPAPP